MNGLDWIFLCKGPIRLLKLWLCKINEKLVYVEAFHEARSWTVYQKTSTCTKYNEGVQKLNLCKSEGYELIHGRFKAVSNIYTIICKYPVLFFTSGWKVRFYGLLYCFLIYTSWLLLVKRRRKRGNVRSYTWKWCRKYRVYCQKGTFYLLQLFSYSCNW